MRNSLRYHIDEMKRLLTLYREGLEKIEPDLLLNKTGPLETIAIYIKVIELNSYIKGLIKIHGEYKSLKLFSTPFEEDLYMSLTKLKTISNKIDTNRDNFIHLIDLQFLKSKNRTLRLWDFEISELVYLYKDALNRLEENIDNAPNTWYNMYKHLEGPKLFLDKDTLTMYKMINDTLNEDFSGFEFYSLIYNKDMNVYKKKQKFDLRSTIPKSIEEKLKYHYPEYFL